MGKSVYRIDTNYQGPTSDDAWPAFVPAAAVLVTCISREGRPNIIPLTGWGVLSRFPFIVGIAICQGHYTQNYFPRHSHRLLQEVPEFVLNIPHTGLREAVTICGGVSGDKVDKFRAANLTPEPSLVVRPPAILECPVNLECQVRKVVNLGSHDVFLGEAVAVHTGIVEQTIEEDLMKMTLAADGDGGGRILWRTLPLWLPFKPACSNEQAQEFTGGILSDGEVRFA
jgi:flavin reductase (DIM6/NTAB) family NADH-FMN oxidoreductase RutF